VQTFKLALKDIIVDKFKHASISSLLPKNQLDLAQWGSLTHKPLKPNVDSTPIKHLQLSDSSRKQH